MSRLDNRNFRERLRNRAVWTREQEEELRALYEEFKDETGKRLLEILLIEFMSIVLFQT